ncbi:MAG: sialidase family protein [Thermoplasmatota archaeon]
MVGRALAIACVAAMVFAGCLNTSTPTTKVDPQSTNKTQDAKVPAGTYVPASLLKDSKNGSAPLLSSLLNASGAARYVGTLGFEPTDGVTRTGAIFYLGQAVMRSTDNGSTWKDVTPRLLSVQDPPNTNDPYLFVDPNTGRVFVDQNQGAACTVLVYSDDLGATWKNGGAPCGPEGANDHQTMVAAKPKTLPTLGYPDVLYICTNGLVTTQCARSLDGGLSWLPSVPVWTEPPVGGCDPETGHLVAASDGTVYLPKGECGVPEVAVTQDDGQTWTIRTVSTSVKIEDHELRVAVDTAGNVYAFWQAPDGLPYLSVSKDKGADWSTPQMVGFKGLTGMDFPAIAAGAPGRIAFAYVGTVSPGPYNHTGNQPVTAQLAQPANIPGLAWYPYIGFSLNALDPSPTVVTVTAGAPNDPVARGQCGRTRCDGIGDFIDLQMGPDGRPWAAFADACTKACATNANATDNYQGTGGAYAPGFVGTISTGPSLLLNGTLAPLAATAGAASTTNSDASSSNATMQPSLPVTADVASSGDPRVSSSAAN